jgi:hypothetical protein
MSANYILVEAFSMTTYIEGAAEHLMLLLSRKKGNRAFFLTVMLVSEDKINICHHSSIRAANPAENAHVSNPEPATPKHIQVNNHPSTSHPSNEIHHESDKEQVVGAAIGGNSKSDIMYCFISSAF